MANKNAWPDLVAGSIEEERLLLLDIQKRHAEELEQKGIAEKGRLACVSSNLNDLTQLSVALEWKEIEDRTIVELPALRFSTPRFGISGVYRSYDQYVQMAEIGPDSMDLLKDFTMAESDVVMGMIEGLRFARDMGELPHLSSDFAVIKDPDLSRVV